MNMKLEKPPNSQDPPMQLLARIRWSAPYLNPALRRISDYVLRHPELVKSSSIKELAHACDVSESTITRFVRAVDVPNYQQLKIRIAEELSTETRRQTPDGERRLVYEDITPNDGTAAILDKIAGRYAATVRDTLHALNAPQIERAVEAIQNCDLMAFFAIGSSVIAVENALMRFLRIGKQCVFFRDFSVREMSTAALGEKTLAIGISNSGRTITTTNSLKEAKNRGATTLCITSFPDSPITKFADIKLFTPTVNAATGSAEYHESMVSKIAQLQVIDTIYSCFAIRNYERSIETLAKTEVFATNSRL